MASYQIEDCKLYRQSIQISGIPVYIFEEHHLALPAWGTVSSRLGTPLNLVTFDSHTDTHLSFNRHIFEVTGAAPPLGMYGWKNPVISSLLNGRHVRREDFSFEDVFRLTLGYLKNTEQILTGADWGYLASYTVITRSDHPDYARDDRLMGYDAAYLSKASWDSWSGEQVREPLLADFDLDFFGCSTDFDGTFRAKAAPLGRRADACTIAREPSFFDECKTSPDYTNVQALEQLVSFLREVLS